MHIDRLVLKGFDPGDQHRIAADLQSELGRSLANPAMHDRLVGLDQVQHIRVGTTTASRYGKTVSPGILAARAIMRGLKQ